MAQQPAIKLTYFPIPGRAAAIRQAFFIGSIDFEDHTIPFEEFGRLKAAGVLPLGSVPILSINDEDPIPQSNALLRFAAKKAGIYPSDDLEALKVDSLMDTLEEAVAALGPSMKMPDGAEKLAFRKNWWDTKANHALTYVDKVAGANKASAFAVGASLSPADLLVANVFQWFSSGTVDGITAEMLAPFVNIKRVADATMAHEKVAEYHASQKK